MAVVVEAGELLDALVAAEPWPLLTVVAAVSDMVAAAVDEADEVVVVDAESTVAFLVGQLFFFCCLHLSWANASCSWAAMHWP